MIRAVKDTFYWFRNKKVILVADDFGTVDNVNSGIPFVEWNKSGAKRCDDFTEFVYQCK